MQTTKAYANNHGEKGCVVRVWPQTQTIRLQNQKIHKLGYNLHTGTCGFLQLEAHVNNEWTHRSSGNQRKKEIMVTHAVETRNSLINGHKFIELPTQNPSYVSTQTYIVDLCTRCLATLPPYYTNDNMVILQGQPLRMAPWTRHNKRNGAPLSFSWSLAVVGFDRCFYGRDMLTFLITLSIVDSESFLLTTTFSKKKIASYDWISHCKIINTYTSWLL